MNRFEAQGLSGNFEFEADQEFEGTQFENAQFGEAEFSDAEFNGGELEGEWDGEVVRDHRRRPSPTAAPRVRDHRRPAAYRSGTRPSQWSSRAYAAPRSTRWGTRTSYGSRPSYRSSYSPWSRSSYRPWSRASYGQPGQRYRWGQPGLTSGWYRGGQYPGRYWRFGQGQRFPGATSQWGTPQWGTPQWGTPQFGYWDRWGRWRRRYPYGRYGTGGSAYGQPSYDEPPYEEPPMPPPVIVAAPPPQPPMAEPPPEAPPGDPNATTMPPPAQGQAGQAQAQANAEEFFIQPEAFEFDMESPGTEGESFESGFDEFESGPGTLSAPPVDKSPVGGCETRGRPFDDFAFRSAAVPASHGPRIKELAQIIVNSWVTDPSLGIRTVCLEGHTDNVGTTDENMRLGLARAKNLRAKLKQAIFDEAKKTGFGQQITDSVTILVSSRGKADPVASNTTAIGRRRNRRVRFAFST